MKILFLLAALVLTMTVSPQENKYDYYLTKSKNQKTVGTVLLASGVMCIIVAGGISANDEVPTTGFVRLPEHFGESVGLAAGGLILMLAAVPFKISGTSNAEKAAKFSVGAQKVPVKSGDAVYNRLQPAISLRVPLGRGLK